KRRRRRSPRTRARPRRGPAGRGAGATAGNASRRTLSPTGKGPSARSMPVRLWKVAAGEITIPLQEPRLMGLQRLADAIDEHLFGRARAFERIARPDHHIGPAARRQAADLATHSDRLGRSGSDHREGFAPANASRAGDFL